MSAPYIQVHFRLDFLMEANNMSPDQTAPLGAVWTQFILFAVYAIKEHEQTRRADDSSCNWRAKG